MVKHYVVAMTTGTPVRLSSALAVGETDHQMAAIWMQPRGDNAAVIYIGSTATMTSTDYGVRLEIPAAGVPPAPFNTGDFSFGAGYGNRAPIKLSDLYALGTTNDELHILAIWG